MTATDPARRVRFSVRPTPRAARALKSLQLPAFWILGVILLLGLLRLVEIVRADLARYPVATTAAIILFAVYAVPFWLFISSMDFLEREPPLLMATAFVWGGVVATTAAIPGTQAVHDLLAKLVSPTFAAAWGPAIAGPTIEELLKSLGVVMIVLVARKQINSVLDGMVYGALVGLGFQVVENVIYAVNAVALSGRGDGIGPVVATFFLRGFLAGLWSHTLFTALAGAGIAWFLVRTDRPPVQRWAGLLLGLGLCWLTHFIWNSPLLADGLGSGSAGVVLGLLAKGLPALVMVLALVWVARHREASYYVAQLAQLHDPVVATAGELNILGHGHLRADARRYGKARCGRAGERAVRGLQSAQARLAVELSRIAPFPGSVALGPMSQGWPVAPGIGPAAGLNVWGVGPDGKVDVALAACRDDVLAQRRRLRALGHPEAIMSPSRPAVPRIVVFGVLGSLVLFLLIFKAILSMHAA